MGRFDELVRIARSHSDNCFWVFAFDEILWGYLGRARGPKPLFDGVIALEPWDEEGISSLLSSRCREADIEPDFARLLPALPSDADDIDREEATVSTRTGYFRMIWDYSTGNPGIALHTWRRCLGMVDTGVVVRVFSAPDFHELEALPDSAVFVLRAVVQLEHALPSDIVAATQLSEDEVEDALRFGLARGYFERRDSRLWVTWAWFRPITRFLERRHLLYTS
jgi:hypothetical protein